MGDRRMENGCMEGKYKKRKVMMAWLLAVMMLLNTGVSIYAEAGGTDGKQSMKTEELQQGGTVLQVREEQAEAAAQLKQQAPTEGVQSEMQTPTEGSQPETQTEGGQTEPQAPAEGGQTEPQAPTEGGQPETQTPAEGGQTEPQTSTEGGQTEPQAPAEGGQTEPQTSTEGGQSEPQVPADAGQPDGMAEEFVELETETEQQTEQAAAEARSGESCTISFDANGGSGEMEAETVPVGTTYRLPSCSFTAPPGKMFSRWEVNGEQHTSLEDITVETDLTVKALWTEVVAELYRADGTRIAQYGNLSGALAMAQTYSGSTLKLLSDSTDFTLAMIMGGNFTIDINGKQISSSGSAFSIINGTVTFRDTAAQPGQISGSAAVMVVQDSARVIIESGNYFSDANAINMSSGTPAVSIRGGTFKTNGGYDGVINCSAGTLTIEGGTFAAATGASGTYNGAVYTHSSSGTTTITGGSFAMGEQGMILYGGGQLDLTAHGNPVDMVIYNCMEQSADTDTDILLPDGYKLEDREGSAVSSISPSSSATVKTDDNKTVRFDANGGTGTMSFLKVLSGASCTLPECGFTAPLGMQFKAWKIGEQEYLPGASCTITDSITCVAVWEPLRCRVMFAAGGGTGTMEERTVLYGETCVLPECGFGDPENQKFKAWEAGGTEYQPGEELTVTADITVTAQWVTPEALVQLPEQTQYFEFLQEAVDWAAKRDGATVRLFSDVALSQPVTAETAGIMTVALDGHSITCESDRVFAISGAGTVIFTDAAAAGTVKSTSREAIRVASTANITIAGGSYEGVGAVLVFSSSGQALVQGGSFSSQYGIQFSTGSIKATGGSFAVENAEFLYIGVSGGSQKIDLREYPSPEGIQIENASVVRVTGIQLPEGYIMLDSETGDQMDDGVWKYRKAVIGTASDVRDAVSVIGNGTTAYYKTLADAAAAARQIEGAVLTLLRDIATTEDTIATFQNCGCTMDLNGKRLYHCNYSGENTTNVTVACAEGSLVTFRDSTGGGSLSDRERIVLAVESGGQAIVNGGNISGISNLGGKVTVNGGMVGGVMVMAGETVINGGQIGEEGYPVFVIAAESTASLTVTGSAVLRGERAFWYLSGSEYATVDLSSCQDVQGICFINLGDDPVSVTGIRLPEGYELQDQEETAVTELASQSSAVVKKRSATENLEISWGKMAYTYETGTWNPDTHSYEGGGWQPESGGAEDTVAPGTITVTNNSTEELQVTYHFERDTGLTETSGITGLEELKGSFHLGSAAGEEVSSAQTLGTGDTDNTQTVWLSLQSDCPSEPFSAKTLGTVTVMIETEEGGAADGQ